MSIECLWDSCFCFNLVFKKFSYQRGVLNGLSVLVGKQSENDVS